MQSSLLATLRETTSQAVPCADSPQAHNPDYAIQALQFGRNEELLSAAQHHLALAGLYAAGCPEQRFHQMSQHTSCSRLAQTHQNLIMASHDIWTGAAPPIKALHALCSSHRGGNMLVGSMLMGGVPEGTAGGCPSSRISPVRLDHRQPLQTQTPSCHSGTAQHMDAIETP